MAKVMLEPCLEKPERQCKGENSRFIQKVREEDRRDKILEDAFMRSTAENPYHKKVKSSMDLCNVMKEEARQKYLEEKRRQQLRENNQELKLLEVQLRAAYIRKAVSAQLYEQKALKDKEAAKVHAENLTLEEARLKSDEAARKLEEEKQARKDALKQDLQEQIATANAKRQMSYELVMAEKKAMEELARKCNEEKERAKQEAAERKLRAQAEIKEFKRAQEEWKLAQNQKSHDEHERIQELLRQRELELQRAAQRKRELQRRKEQISEEIGKHIHAIATEKDKARDCLAELLIDERQAKEELRMRQELERQMRERALTRAQLEFDREEKERRKQEQRRIDEEFLREEMRVLAERDKLAQLSNEKRRRKQMEHRKELQEVLDETKRRKAEQMKLFLRAREAELIETEENQKLVEEERIRMLKEHASSLMGYLTPGILRDSDRKFLAQSQKQN